MTQEKGLPKEIEAESVEARAARRPRAAASGPRPEWRPRAAPPHEIIEPREEELTEEDRQLRDMFLREAGVDPFAPDEGRKEDAGGAAPRAADAAPQAAASASQAAAAQTADVPAKQAPPPEKEAPAPAPSQAEMEKAMQGLDKAIESSFGEDTPKDWRTDLLELRRERILRRLETLRRDDPLMTEGDDAEVLMNFVDLYSKLGDGATVDMAYHLTRSRKAVPERLAKLAGASSGPAPSRTGTPPAPASGAGDEAASQDGQGAHRNREATGVSAAPAAQAAASDGPAPLPQAAGGRPAVAASAPSGGTVASRGEASRAPWQDDPGQARRARDRARMSKGGPFERDIASLFTGGGAR